jgi:hypothetical protein
MPEPAEYGLTETDLRILREVVAKVRAGQFDLPRGEIRPNGTRILLAKCTSSVAKGASGTFKVYSGTTKGSEADTGIEIEAYCRMAAYTADTWAYLEPVDSGWEAAPECA